MWPQYTDAERQSVLDKMQAAGITWVRIDASWARLEETAKGAYNSGQFAALQHCIDFSRAHNMQVLINVLGTPNWANGGAGGKAPPANVADYAGFMATIAGLFKGKIAAWQIYNELNNGGFWSGTKAQYVALLQAAYPAIKGADPSALVVLGGIMWQDAPYLDSLYDIAGFKDSFDVVATHGFQWVSDTPPERPDDGNVAYISHAPAVRQVMVDHGDGDAQFWFTEAGWSTHENTCCGFDTTANPWSAGVDEAKQADYSVRTIDYVRANFPWLGVMFFYKERTFVHDGTWPSVQEQGYGMLNESGNPRPVYTALKQRITGSP
jgi:arabinogalactan endo-1,4-beta-galactosidase